MDRLENAIRSLVEIVDGHRIMRWHAEGTRLVDTPEWCELYCAWCEHQKRSKKPNRLAQDLGRMARGKPKRFSADQIARRTAIIQRVNDRRRSEAIRKDDQWKNGTKSMKHAKGV